MLIPLPKAAAGDFSSRVEIVYAGRLSEAGDWWKTWSFPSPRVVGLPVVETQWTLYLPEDFNYSMFGGTLEVAEPAYLLLNRQATQFREAFDLVEQAQHGKGYVRQAARDNLKQLGLAIDKVPAKKERTQQLLEQMQSDAEQLGAAIQRLQAEPEITPAAASQVSLDEYFIPVAAPQSRGGADSLDSGNKRLPMTRFDREQDKKTPAPGRRQAVRDKLQSQAEQLNEMRLQQLQKQELATPTEPQAEASPRSQQSPASIPTPGVNSDRLLAPSQTGVPGPGLDDQQSAVAGGEMAGEPTRAGSLSLRIELPMVGQPLHFFKAHGDPVLSMQVTSAEFGQWSVAVVRMLVVLTVALSIGWFAGRPGLGCRLARRWRETLLLLGVVWWSALSLSFLGFVVTVIAFFICTSHVLRSRFAPAAA